MPILQAKVEVDPVTLWSPGGQPALRALWLKNTSGLTLDRGSFSIVEGGNFSGQGLLDPIHAGERRLLSYAADEACTCQWIMRMTRKAGEDHDKQGDSKAGSSRGRGGGVPGA